MKYDNEGYIRVIYFTKGEYRMRGHSFHEEIDIDFLINISNILLRERRYFILLRISKIVTIIFQRVSTVYNIYS